MLSAQETLLRLAGYKGRINGNSPNVHYIEIQDRFTCDPKELYRGRFVRPVDHPEGFRSVGLLYLISDISVDRVVGRERALVRLDNHVKMFCSVHEGKFEVRYKVDADSALAVPPLVWGLIEQQGVNFYLRKFGKAL